MSSKGSPVWRFRCPPELVEDIETQLEMSADTRRGEPWTVTDFIRIAIREKLSKMARSRDHRRRGQRLRERIAAAVAAATAAAADQVDDGVDLGREIEVEHLSAAEMAEITAAVNASMEAEFGRYEPTR